MEAALGEHQRVVGRTVAAQEERGVPARLPTGELANLHRQVADIVLVHLDGELALRGQRMESGRLRERRIDQRLRDAVAEQVVEADLLERPAQLGAEPFARSGVAGEVRRHVQ